MTRHASKTLGFIRAALVVAAGIPFLTVVSALAQDPNPAPAPAGGTAEVERVFVIGSNIPTAEEVGPNPVLNLNRDMINKSGERNAEELLKALPAANSNSVPTANNGTSQGGPAGATSVSLRGFDATGTLALVNGRRVVPFPGSGFFDLNTIPLAAIETIEILKDGASTTYGADAVAGVVNFKLYQHYRGAQLRMQYGNTLDKDAGLYSADVLFGTGDDKISISGDVFYYHRNSTFNKDRGNSAIPPFLSSNTTPYNFQVEHDVAVAAVVASGGNPAIVPGVSGQRIFTTPPNGTNGNVPASDYFYGTNRVRRTPGGTFPGFNFNTYSSSYPNQDRWGGYAYFDDKICDDRLVIYADFYYADVQAHDELAPGATNNWQTPGQATLAIPPHSPITPGSEPPGTPTYADTGLPPGAYNPFNPFDQVLSGGTRSRLFEFGNRLIDNESIAWLATLGVKGDKLFNGSWGYDGAFRYSHIETIAQIQDASVSRFKRINNANDSIYDPNSGDYIGTTIPFDPFGDPQHVVIASNRLPVAFATLKRRDLTTAKLATADFNIYTTDLFDLPAGGVGLALGGVFSTESLRVNPDDSGRVVDQAGVGQSFFELAGRKEYAFHAEGLIPITSPTMNIPFFHTLELSASTRYEAFRNNTTNTLVPKVGLRWQPFDEQLTIRSTWGEGFREPSLVELYGGPLFGLALTSVPGGNTEPETTQETDPNPSLQPERSRTWTGGVVYTPKWIPTQWGTLTLSVDLWDIERKGVVTSPSAQSIVLRYLNFINHGGPPLAPGEQVVLDPSGNSVIFVKGVLVNAGRQNGRGADFVIQYQVQLPFEITLSSLTQASYLDSFIFQLPGNKGREVSGRSNNDWYTGNAFGAQTGGDGWQKWKGTERVDLAWKNWDLNWTLHFTDGFQEIFYQANEGALNGYKEHYVHQTWFNDAQLSYELIFAQPVETQPVAGYSKGSKDVIHDKEGKAIESGAAYAMPCWQTILNNSKLTLGVNNIFGQDPPKMYGQDRVGNSIGYPGYLYDNLGRFLYIELVKKF